jgi:hypothetical protein
MIKEIVNLLLTREIAMINEWRKKIWDWCTATDFRTHISHLLLILFGTVLPALCVQTLWHNLALSVVAGNLFCEWWMYFFAGREVADYIGHKNRAKVVEEMDRTWLDGLGDLAGPVFVRTAWWAGLLTLLFGG